MQPRNLQTLNKKTWYIFLSKSDDNEKYMEELFQNIKTIHFPSSFSSFGCANRFWDPFRGRSPANDFYFGFYQQPYWMVDLVDEFNSIFKNIKIEIVKKIPSVIFVDETGWGKAAFFTSDHVENPVLKSGLFIYNIKFNEKVPINIIDKLTYVIHHFLRYCSFGEKNIHYNDKEIISPVGSLIDLVLERVSKKRGQSRSLSEIFVTREDFFALDDLNALELFDRETNRAAWIKQTDIIYIISLLSKYGEDFLEIFDWQYANLQNPKLLCSIILSAMDGTIAIIKKPSKSAKFFEYGVLNSCQIFCLPSHRFSWKYGVGEIKKLPYARQGGSVIAGRRYFTFYPLTMLYLKYPELDENIMKEVVHLINESSIYEFKVPDNNKILE